MSRDEVVRMRKGHSPGGHLGMLQAEGAPRARALGWKAQSRGCSRRDLGGDWKGMGCKPLDQGCCRVSPPPPAPERQGVCNFFEMHLFVECKFKSAVCQHWNFHLCPQGPRLLAGGRTLRGRGDLVCGEALVGGGRKGSVGLRSLLDCIVSHPQCTGLAFPAVTTTPAAAPHRPGIVVGGGGTCQGSFHRHHRS